MKDFRIVCSFYLKKELKSKAFLITTLIMCVISAASIFILSTIMEKNEKTILYIVDQTKQLNGIWDDDNFVHNIFDNLKLDFSLLDSDKSIDEMNKIVNEDKSIVVFNEENDVITMNLIGKDNIAYNDITILQSVTLRILQEKRIKELGISSETVKKINPVINVELSNEFESEENYVTIIGLLLLMVIVIIMYSNSASNEIAYLKTNRVMEIISTSVKPLPVYLGVNFAGGLIPFIQLAFIGVSGYITKKIVNVDFENVNEMVGINLNALQLKTLFIYLVLLLLGFFVYAFINTAVASIVSKSEDVVTVSVPIAFIGLIQYFIGVMALDSDSTFLAFASYFPLTSPSVMFTRYSLGYVGIFQVLISMIILFITLAVLAYYGSIIFRYGVTYYGNLKDFSFKAKKSV